LLHLGPILEKSSFPAPFLTCGMSSGLLSVGLPPNQHFCEARRSIVLGLQETNPIFPCTKPVRAPLVSAGVQGVTQHFPGNFLSGIVEVLPAANQVCGFSRVCLFLPLPPAVCVGANSYWVWSVSS